MQGRLPTVKTSVARPPAVRSVTLAQARALTCNACGDCCDSRRTDGWWTWGALPPDQFGSLTGGRPLIIPLARVDGCWRDRAAAPEDRHELSATRFRCAAFRPQTDGSGRCARHDQTRPARCAAFPVAGGGVEADLRVHGEAWLQTDAFPRCTWYRVCVVREDDPRLSAEGTTRRAEETPDADL